MMVRLATALARRHQVTCYVIYHQPLDHALLADLHKAGVQVHFGPFSGFLFKFFFWVSTRIQKLIPSFCLFEYCNVWKLRQCHRSANFDVANGHMPYAERMLSLAFKKEKLPLVGTDHGCYRELDSTSFLRDLYQPVFRRSDALVCPSDSNVELATMLPWKPSFKIHKVYYGYPCAYDLRSRSSIETITRFGLVARGVPEKGWAEAIAAWRLIPEQLRRQTHMTFVGGGDFLPQLRSSLTQEERPFFNFTGYLPEPSEAVKSFDVGLLPSYWPLESLPNSIIEYLSFGIPVIATSVGGISEMLETPSGPAGILIPLNTLTGKADVPLLAQAMISLAADSALKAALVRRTQDAFRKFQMDECISAYESAFTEATATIRSEGVPT